MINVVLSRYYLDDQVTLGLLKIKDVSHKPIYTLENPWLDNKRNISCIPEGVYECKPFSGVKYKSVYQILDVPDRSYILFHTGNYARNSNGCILLGLASDPTRPEPMIIQSTNAINLFRELIVENRFQLEVKNI